jgi:hypothetical protein
MRRMMRRLWSAAMLAATVVAPGTIVHAGPCPTTLPQGSDPVTLDPADFVSQIDNQYWPMAPGTKWRYRESDPRGNAVKVRVVVTDRTRQIQGIDATVVHDVVSDHGELVENTFDWYAQDACGNVWYMGERTKEYEHGQVVSTEGSWEAGVDGAQAGVVMPGDPQVGLAYRQEYYAGEAEDAAEVLSLVEKAQVPFGRFDDVLLTKESTPLHPKVLEYKMYAPGVGPVLAIGVSGGSDREALIGFTPPAP